ncbi:hypothetical protein ACFE04_031268 [Oxalis oulophora]
MGKSSIISFLVLLLIVSCEAKSVTIAAEAPVSEPYEIQAGEANIATCTSMKQCQKWCPPKCEFKNCNGEAKSVTIAAEAPVSEPYEIQAGEANIATCTSSKQCQKWCPPKCEYKICSGNVCLCGIC